MTWHRNIFILTFVIALTLVTCTPPPAYATCLMSWCTDDQPVKKRTHITNTHRQKVGDLYDSGTGRIQIRDTSRRIVGYVERSGRITNINRQKIGSVNE